MVQTEFQISRTLLSYYFSKAICCLQSKITSARRVMLGKQSWQMGHGVVDGGLSRNLEDYPSLALTNHPTRSSPSDREWMLEPQTAAGELQLVHS